MEEKSAEPGFYVKSCFLLFALTLVWLAFLAGIISYVGIYEEFDNEYYRTYDDITPIGHLFTDFFLFVLLTSLVAAGVYYEHILLLGVATFGYVVMFFLGAVTIYYSIEDEERSFDDNFIFRTIPCRFFNELNTNEFVTAYFEGSGYISIRNNGFGQFNTVVRSCRTALAIRFFILFLNFLIVPFGIYIIRFVKRNTLAAEDMDKEQINFRESL